MIIDGTDLILGRLASFAAKKALLGEEVIIVNSEKVMITGSKKNVLDNYKRKISMGSVRWGPFFPRTSERILRRTIRCMLPYKKDRGRKAYKKIKCFIGVPEKYKENIFLTKYEGRDFAVKPMNCPGGMLVYKSTPKTYRHLPLRVGEMGIVHRQELSGVLNGLFRVIKFTQDDAHIFCTEKQLEDELVGVIELIDFFYKKFGFDYHVELSTRPEKRIGNDAIWDKAERALEGVLKKKPDFYLMDLRLYQK